VGFVVVKVALGQVFLRVLKFSPLNITALYVAFHSITWRTNKRPVKGRSSETQSHPIDMKNNNNNVPEKSNTVGSGCTGIEAFSII
jgi:hypothetical protein